MKRIILSSLVLLALLPASLLAKPVEVLVFPTGAIVTEVSGVAVSAGSATLALPAVADTASLKVATVDSTATISGLRFDSVSETGADYRALEEKVEATREKLQDVEDRRAARERALGMWQASLGDEFTSAEEYRKLAGLVLAETEELGREHS
ncbi:MAG: DUF4140 domain-containing protein, partial [Desulfuromonadales bacterium]|nr:DUF4140 domain-containing protein [Desulfuromonadales bacterium]NIS42137.1 DUF4140 domain-containing protein [Desulfuromonadales bacterium]